MVTSNNPYPFQPSAGDVNIGNVDVLTVPADPFGANADAAVAAGAAGSLSAKLRRISADIGALVTGTVLAAGSNLIGKVISKDSTDVIYDGTTALTPKFSKVDCAASGDNTIVAAVTSKKIRVLSYVLVASAAVTAAWKSDNTSGGSETSLSGAMSFAANGGAVAPYNPAGWFETASGKLLNLELGGAQQVSGHISYIEV